MDEQQILKQLNSLSEEVKPREKWVNMTKSELFEEQQQQEAAATLISKAFAPLRKPVMALAALGLIALTLGSAMFYSPQLVKIDEPMPRIGQNDNPQLAASVEQLSKKLKGINERLTRIKNSDNIEQIIPKLAAVEATARRGAKIATTAESTKTFASLADSFNETAEAANTQSSQMIKKVIEEFEDNKEHLSEVDQERLRKAREAYDNQEFSQAFLLLRPLLK